MERSKLKPTSIGVTAKSSGDGNSSNDNPFGTVKLKKTGTLSSTPSPSVNKFTTSKTATTTPKAAFGKPSTFSASSTTTTPSFKSTPLRSAGINTTTTPATTSSSSSNGNTYPFKRTNPAPSNSATRNSFVANKKTLSPPKATRKSIKALNSSFSNLNDSCSSLGNSGRGSIHDSPGLGRQSIRKSGRLSVSNYTSPGTKKTFLASKPASPVKASVGQTWRKSGVGGLAKAPLLDGGSSKKSIESYSTKKQLLSQTGKQSRLDEAKDEKTIVNDYANLFLNGILAKVTNDNDRQRATAYFERIKQSNGLPQIRRLSIRDNDIVTTLTRVMGNDPNIKEVTIRKDERFGNLPPSLVTGFAESLRYNVNVQKIIMTSIELGNDFLGALADSINTNFTLQYLDLSNNCFTNDALVDFCINLENNNTLSTIYLQKQQSPIFTHREELVMESLQKNNVIQILEIEFQSAKCTTELKTILQRNASSSLQNGTSYSTQLLKFLEQEAILCEKRFQQRKEEAIAQEITEDDMPFLYELSELAQKYKLQYDTIDNSPNSPMAGGLSSPSNAKTSIASISSNILSADGAFLTDDFITQYLQENKDDGSLSFEFTNESKLMKRFSVTDPARAFIVSKFVDTIVDHPKANEITHLNMANTMMGNDFCIALSNRCLNDSTLLTKLHLINLETNLISGPGITALSKCIGHPRTWKYVQAIKLDNQRHLISSEAEADLANALCVNHSVIKVSLRVRTLYERRKVNNFVVRNIDFLRQARRWYGLKTGTIKERERNKIEKMFDAIAANDPTITEVQLVSDQVFVSLSPEEVLKAAESFANNQYVTKVKMSGLRLDDQFGIKLGNSLLTNRSIERLDIESNAIGSDGLLAIIKSLQTNSTLTELFVRHQSKPMASTDEEKIPAFIEDNETILKLSVDLRSIGSRDYVDKKCRMNQEKKRKLTPKKSAPNTPDSNTPTKRNRIHQIFDKIAANDPSITTVEIVNDQVFLGLNDIELQKAASSFAKNTHVTKVKMSGLKLDDAFGITLGKSLQTNTTIKSLDLERNSIGTDGMTAILSTLCTNHTITEVFVRHQSKPLSSPDEEKVPSYIVNNNSLIKLSIDIRSVGAKNSIDKKIRMNQELKRKSK